MRDYRNVEMYLTELMGDVYPQPPDANTQALIECVAEKWLPQLQGLSSILDVGCAQGQAIPVLERHCERVIGVTLGTDAQIASHAGHMVYFSDMTFLPFGDQEFMLLWCRHVLEHSPMPLLTLMEWHRVARQWAVVITPTIKQHGYGGGQHYFMLEPRQWETLFRRAGWKVMWNDFTSEIEHRWFLEKGERPKGSPG